MIPIASLASAGYLNLVWLLHKKDQPTRLPIILVASIALLAHSAQVILLIKGLMHDVSVTNILTLVALCMTIIGSIRYVLRNDQIAYRIVSLIAAVCVWFPVILPAPSTIAHSWGLKVHIVLSIAAYIALAFAALYAAILLIQDYRLRRGQDGLTLSIPLNELDKTMISFTRFGEILLTLSLATGILFIHNIWEQHVEHKLFFGLTSWTIIVILLLMNHLFGMRGRLAALWILGGFACLVCAYFGSAFVLQIILPQ